MIELWHKILLEPLINGLLVLSGVFGGSFGMAIIALTILVNLAVLPLTLRQLRATKSMQMLQPKMKELQKKYAKDKAKLQQETLKLYKESGVNPLGCVFPLLVQMPILIALYQAIMQSLATTPERLFGLSQNLYSWSPVQQAVPPDNSFLWLDMAAPNLFITLLIMASMWISQKMSATPSTDPQQQQMQNMMQWMMPIMFGLIFMAFPSGLGLYVVVGNLFRIIMQYFVMGNWGELANVLPGRTSSGPDAKEPKKKKEIPYSANITKNLKSANKKTKASTIAEDGKRDGTAGNKRKKR
ncbi:MAG: YidC/Oxa1 family membrane protein insertase [Dehalococcoidia bacterium]|nr:YidC/Oxa1 family membrane protein insertase [Dehalococcoidia bacterium]